MGVGDVLCLKCAYQKQRVDSDSFCRAAKMHSAQAVSNTNFTTYFEPILNQIFNLRSEARVRLWRLLTRFYISCACYKTIIEDSIDFFLLR